MFANLIGIAILCASFVLSAQELKELPESIDKNGYIVYCPCMGRFGNQAEQLLGSLQFAKSINRTLVLPPFIEYQNYHVKLVPFKDYIQIEPIYDFHRVISMEYFMTDIAPLIWTEERRIITCYTSRSGSEKDGCNPFEGNPFKSFWHHFNITSFKGGSQFYSPLALDHSYAQEWKEKFRANWVLALVGAPSAFPTNDQALLIQEHIHFSLKLAEEANQYREKRGFAKKAYLAIHLRHGSDWVKACDLLKQNQHMKQLFSSHQCTHRSGNNRKSDAILHYELCYPTYESIIKQIKDVVAHVRTPHIIDTLYIASDKDNENLWIQMHAHLGNISLIAPSISISPTGHLTRHKPPTYMIDAYLMSYSNHFIGNCISSFTAFVSRFRTYNLHFKESTNFFSEDKIVYQDHNVKDEL